ncbi:MAG TPA: S8/S53 family peptidase [Mycobacteriales bacterium]|jgi:hypothetical protein|nr:S8/S53 family peptidase [Mycobacteriales bacterium]
MTPQAPETSVGGEIVVATPHVQIVEEELAKLKVVPVGREVSSELGLTLLRLSPDHVREAAGPPPTSGRLATADALTRLLDALYQRFERRYGGWRPTMGKNRWVGSVHNITGGGEGAPRRGGGRLHPRESEPGSRVRVGVTDTGLYHHAWYAGASHCPPASRLPTDVVPARYETGHATFVTGLILQEAPGATVEMRRVLDDDGRADSWSVASKLVLLARAELDVLNLSLGCFTDDNSPPLVLSTALDRMPPHVVVVAAAGNHGATDPQPQPFWPAALEEVVAVGAVDADGQRPPWSPDASRLPWVDVVATGVGVESTYLPAVQGAEGPEDFGETATWSGTSFAAAKVTGVLAARTVPGVLSAGYVLRDLVKEPPRRWQGVPWLA